MVNSVWRTGVVLLLFFAVQTRADVPGCQSLTLSPFLDHPPLVQFITGLRAEDLVKWETFERVRTLLGEANLVFRLRKAVN